MMTCYSILYTANRIVYSYQVVPLITPVAVASQDSNRPRHVDDVMLYIGTLISVYVIGPAKTGHIYTNYTYSENSSFLGLCL